MLRLVITGDIGFEFWKDIPNIKNYQASTYGRVRSLDRYIEYLNRFGTYTKKFTKGQIIDCSKQEGRKYYHFTAEKKDYSIHRSVALTFLPNDDPQHKTYVNHKDENTHNNAVWNLEFVTPRENTVYGTGIKRARKKTLGVKKYYNRVPIIELSKDGEFIKEWDSSASAAEYYRISRSAPGQACKNGKIIKGHKWMKASEYHKNKEGA